jgi:hypothetical protein
MSNSTSSGVTAGGVTYTSGVSVVNISNQSGYSLEYVGTWLQNGQVSDNFQPPKTIANGAYVTIAYTPLPPGGSVSGFVVYNLINGDVYLPVTIAFQNQETCNVGVGPSGLLGDQAGDNGVWLAMRNTTPFFPGWGVWAFDSNPLNTTYLGVMLCVPNPISQGYIIILQPALNAN